ncbi:MAG: hypothetical protein ACR2O0_11415, partial [Rhizobiaceae bacterium]
RKDIGSETDRKIVKPERKSPSLSESIKKIRENQASRNDVVVEMAQAARARMELLVQELEPVIDEIPDDVELFEFKFSGGSDTRFWIDMTSFVRMGRDRRLYEFVKDTRLGRTLIGSTTDRHKMAEMVTQYVAERLLDREYTIEGDWQALKLRQADGSSESTPDVKVAHSPSHFTGFVAIDSSRRLWLTILYSLAIFGAGFMIGAATLVLWAWFGGI